MALVVATWANSWTRSAARRSRLWNSMTCTPWFTSRYTCTGLKEPPTACESAGSGGTHARPEVSAPIASAPFCFHQPARCGEADAGGVVLADLGVVGAVLAQ
jgi:hypothetical protein